VHGDAEAERDQREADALPCRGRGRGQALAPQDPDAYLDTQKVRDACDRMAAAGIVEAGAAPIEA
jgi:hypothetical protein